MPQMTIVEMELQNGLMQDISGGAGGTMPGGGEIG